MDARPIRIDPRIPVRRLVAALPSAAAMFERFGIDPASGAAVAEACAAAGLAVSDLERALGEIDWGREA